MSTNTPATTPKPPPMHADLRDYAQRIHPLIGQAVERILALQVAGAPENTWQGMGHDCMNLMALYKTVMQGVPLNSGCHHEVDVLIARLSRKIGEEPIL